MNTTISSAGGGQTINFGTILKKAKTLLSVAKSSVYVFFSNLPEQGEPAMSLGTSTPFFTLSDQSENGIGRGSVAQSEKFKFDYFIEL